jgi:hypothetical protein
MHRTRTHLTYANVMATLAVFLVLGGGAYAAFQLPKDSVRSSNIVDGQVKSQDLGIGDALRFKDAVGTSSFRPIQSGKFILTTPPISANSCTGPSVNAPGVNNQDHILVTATQNSLPSGLLLSGVAGNDEVVVNLCNITTSTINPSGYLRFHWLALR